MINAVRTLLLNQSSAVAWPVDQAGAQYVSPAYRPVVLPPALFAIRGALFGWQPDNLTLNYRLAQYMALLHADDACLPHVLSMDHRFTYRPHAWRTHPWGIVVTPLSGDGRLEVTGQFAGDDVMGRNHDTFDLSVDTGEDSLTVASTLGVVTHALSAASGDNFLALGNGLSLRITADDDCGFRLEVSARPSRSLPEILAGLDATGDVVSRSLSRHPLFENMYRRGESSTRRLCGALLGLAFATLDNA